MSREKIASLHSRYNPQIEADRYIAALPLDEQIRFFILIEPGLGYMVAPLKTRFPHAKIISLHADAPPAACDADRSPAVEAPDSRWHPGTGVSAQDFLEREIPDSAAAEIRILEWRPSLSAYGGAYLALVEESAQFIKRADANARTINAFSKRWFRNFIKNLGIMRKVICPSPFAAPILVTGAGPSLDDAIPLIRAAQHGSLFVLAAASSAPALHAAQIAPTMLISTDGGIWAAFHLFDSLRGAEIPCPPIAAALTAALPSQCADTPILPISDGSFWQTLILKELKIPFIALPPRGTVSASALDLAFALTSGDIFIAGLDLANCGIRSHARPYSLDRFLEEKASRLDPVYSQSFKRSSLLKAGGSYGIYASWFKKQLAAYPSRLYSIGKNNHVFCRGAMSAGQPQLTQAAGLPSPRGWAAHTTAIQFAEDPCRRAYGILEEALRNPAYSQAAQEDLTPILLGGAGESTAHDLIDALRSFAGGEGNA
ncbi:MAG: DUF115 domain-containing protein [Treponema sp.]|nr:DUF115 domain-containing protein [Treponema sp.]